MRWTRELRVKLAVAIALLLLSTLTACTVSAAGGIIGGAGSMVFALFLLFTGTSQSGCGPVFGPCLSPVGPCLSETYEPDDAGPIENVDLPADAAPHVGPCLSVAMPPPDAGIDARMGPCQSPIEPDMGPCLSPPKPDVGPCLSPVEPDLGVCLSEMFDMDVDLPDPTGTADTSPVDDRASSIDKLEGKLPADVMQRLRDSRGENN